MILDITATNSVGDIFVFDEVNKIVNGLDLSGITADVNYTDSSLGGSRYQNTRLRNRELSLEVQLRKRNQTEVLSDIAREKAIKVFNPETNPIRFDFKTSNGDSYYLTAYAIHAPIMATDATSDNAAYQRMLLQFTCTDPYIYQSFESKVDIGSYLGGFQFDLSIPQEGIPFEEKSNNPFGIVEYNGSSTSGMTIRFVAKGTVSNPYLVNVTTTQMLKLNFDMQNGDVIIVDTYRGERSIRLQRGRINVNIFNSYNLNDSTFLQLNPGTNIFRSAADSGEDNLEVNIQYKVKKVGL